MSAEYSKDPMIYGKLYNLCGVRFLGTGLTAALNHQHWFQQRRMIEPAFKRTYLMGLMGIFDDQAEELMKVLAEKADGETKVDVMNLLRRVTLDIIAKAAFGLELKTLHDDQTPFPHAVNMVNEGLSNSRVPLFEYLPWNRKLVREIQESVRLLRHTGKECIEQRRKAIQKGEEVPVDILTQILKVEGRRCLLEGSTISCVSHFTCILGSRKGHCAGFWPLASSTCAPKQFIRVPSYHAAFDRIGFSLAS
ncbi:cholesterol 24-hydroxylase-like [Varanus komodoensis]|uniref:cholesterol 24-hydroxylase-like n=1 Tax=Varanus komodoensis TaxID=61221 RepID=UPI001CF7BB7E|nr:cholesterol 24-hydroxylase-like [Varanus komodoensis]